MIPGWHPLVVHFPLALWIAGVLALIVSRLVGGGRLAAALATAGTWNLIAGAAAALVAIATGAAALIGLHAAPAAHRAILVHVKWATLTSTIAIMLAVWRGAGNAHDERPSWAMLALLLAAAVAMGVTGYRGDVNVYRYGVGVTVPTAPAGPIPRRGP